MHAAVSVLVVDDKAPFRLAATAVLAATEGFELVGEAANGLEAISLTETLRPDLVLMDINMPELGGLEATRRITVGYPGTVVFLCSTYDPSDLPEDARACGARGYVHKERLDPPTLSRLWDERGSRAFVT